MVRKVSGRQRVAFAALSRLLLARQAEQIVMQTRDSMDVGL
jgi:hypothetical protein